MKIEPTIQSAGEKILVGMPMTMSITANLTGQLFGAFMPRRKEISNLVSQDVLDLKEYPADYFQHFDPAREFTKWALAEVSSAVDIPQGMKEYNLPDGLYAVFDYRGSAADPAIFQYIFSQWLPASGFRIDHRPHFEILGEKFRPNDPDSQEEIWIPVTKK